MSGTFQRAFAFAAAGVLAACSANASNPTIPAQQSPAQVQSFERPSFAGVANGMRGAEVPPIQSAGALRRLCDRPADPRERRCEAIVRADVPATMTPAGGTPQGYSPADLQSAYGLTGFSASNGHGQTVAIVDAYDDPDAESNLGVYRQTYGLPACTTANGCFRKVNEHGQASPLPQKNTGWGGEESLDLDMVSAICPNCHILFVEASNAGGGLDVAVDTAAALGANVISNSYGGGEYAKSDPAFVHPGVVITASAGDGDYYDCDPGSSSSSSSSSSSVCTGPEQPASFAGVVAVGGTRLERQSGTARGWSESVWNSVLPSYDNGGTGSGCSALVPKPAWQTDRGCPKRSETDVSAEADPGTPVAVYDTFGGGGGWQAYGGTSVSSPLIAGVFALAGNATTVPEPEGLWQHAGAGLNDITVGNNLVPRSVNPQAKRCPAAWRYICYAGAGYDGPTGWGTPNGIGAF